MNKYLHIVNVRMNETTHLVKKLFLARELHTYVCTFNFHNIRTYEAIAVCLHVMDAVTCAVCTYAFQGSQRLSVKPASNGKMPSLKGILE